MSPRAVRALPVAASPPAVAAVAVVAVLTVVTVVAAVTAVILSANTASAIDLGRVQGL